MKSKMLLVLSLLLVLVLAMTLGCGDDDDDDAGAADDDSADDDDDTADDDDDDTTGPDTVTIESVKAPTQYEVRATFETDLGSFAQDAANYSIGEAKNTLAIDSVTYDSQTKTTVLVTGKQKLGIEYTLTFAAGDAQDQASFISADTAQFWVIDFSDYHQYRITTDRMAVGDTAVIYIEQGWTVPDVNETIAAFDDTIHPTLTDLFAQAPDQDGNDRITILGLAGDGYYGGYFDPVNTYSEENTMDWWGMHSNEMEIVHINVEMETLAPYHVVAHEFQHLLYNGVHGQSGQYYAYHDEGLAECAVHAVSGPNQRAIDTLLNDWDGEFAAGLSLVNWQYANYDNYALAYLFWTYLAGQVDGVSTYGDIFDLSLGDPILVDGLIQDLLGPSESFASVQLAHYIASWVQAPTGPYGYGSMLSFNAASAPTVNAGTTSLDLEPYAGVWFALSQAQVDYPGTQGANIVYAGIDDAGNVDLTAPFDVDGGVLVVHNANQNYNTFPPEHSGPDIAATKDKSVPVPFSWRNIPPTWLDPPPVTPDRRDLIDAWRAAAKMRLAEDPYPFAK